MASYRVQVCRRVWETAAIDIDDATSDQDAVAQAEELLASIDEESLDWATSDADSHAEVDGVAPLRSTPRA